jgi:membrane-associated protein
VAIGIVAAPLPSRDQRQYARLLASPVVQADLALLGSLSPAHLLNSFGVIGVFVVLFLEMGVLLAFFLPGDSLLFVAGYATVAHKQLGFSMPLGWLLLASAIGAIAGAQLGYELGRRAGPALHQRPDTRLFKQDYVRRTDHFLEQFGSGKAVVFSRFVPLVRTFVSPLVGVAGMSPRDFAIWNVVSGIAWTVPLILLGRALGHIAFVSKHIEVLALVIVLISVIPAVVHYLRRRQEEATA